MKYRLLIIAFTLSISASYSSDVKFYNINDMYRVSMRITQSVCRDDNGFIWVSSQMGIMRIAGNDCRIYQFPYEQGNFLYLRLVYRNSELIAFTNNGQVFRYNPVLDRFDALFNMRNLLNSKYLWLKNVIIDDNGEYFLATKYGLYQYREGELTKLLDVPEEYVIRYDDVHLFIADEKEISILNTKTLEKKSLYRHPAAKLFPVTKLFFDKECNRLWVGTLNNGLYYYDFQTSAMVFPVIRQFPKQPVLAIEANSDSTILVGIDGQGVWELNKTRLTVSAVYRENENDPHSLSGDGIYDIFYDRRSERVWICTYTGGVSFYEQKSPLVKQITHQIANPNSLNNNSINQILEDREGKIWFATNNGISCWNVKTDKWATYYRNEQDHARVFLSLCEDNEGNIWCGTYSSGIYVLNGKTGKETAHYSKEEPGEITISDFVFDIYKDSEGDIWVGGTQKEVACYLVKQKRFRKYAFRAVSAFAEWGRGKMLMACASGLSVLDKESGKVEDLTNAYLLQDIALFDNEIWLCTGGDGLLRYNPESKAIRKYTTENGLPSNYINSILLTDSCLWLGTESGLCGFIPKDESIHTYPSLLPVSNVSFNRIAKRRLRDGQLIFGTNKGAVMFDPAKLYQIHRQGRIFVQDIIVSGYSIRENQDFQLNMPLDSLPEITLNYNQNNLTLELLPLGDETWSSMFSWKMEGLDAGWSHPSAYNRLVYTNIPSGTFVLKVKMLDNFLSQVINERQITITVNPPFWKTWWFPALLFVFLSAVVYSALRFYINRLKQKHTEEKVRFFTNTAHDLRTSLTLIKAPVEELQKETGLTGQGRQYLHLAVEQARRLASVVTQLMDFQKVDVGKGQLSLEKIDAVQLIKQRKMMFEAYAKSKNIELIFTHDQPVLFAVIDESMIEKVTDNLISNAIKYSHDGGRVQIILKSGRKNWTLEVTDQGIGISRKARRKLFREFYRSENAVNSKVVGSGIGLLLVKNYVEMHGGKVSCISQENAGSTFRIVVPVREASKKPVIPRLTRDSLKEPVDYPEIADQVTSCRPEWRHRNGKPAGSIRILIVEDNNDLQQFMHNALCNEFTVSTAGDGAKAWEIIQREMPDMVVSDVMMPEMDGFELCTLMKSTYETSHIPIILLTALSEKTQQLHGLGLGADDYLTKPFDITLLTQRIKSIIRNRKVIREKALKLIKIDDNSEQISVNRLNDTFLKQALDMVHLNMANPEFDKDGFASAMNISASLLYKKIKSLTDLSLVDFIRTIRLNYALELLQSRKYSITEVSKMCGFSSNSYFSTAFRKHFDRTPSEVLE